MKSYFEASKFPLIGVAGRRIPRVILGQHPYDGTTYTSWERDQAYRRRWTGPQSMVELLKPIVHRFGVTASREVPSDSALSRWHQDALRLTMEALQVEIALIVGTVLPLSRQPETAEYLYRLNYELAGEAFAQTWRNDPITHYRFERQREQADALERFVKAGRAASVTPPSAWQQIEVDYEKLDALLDRYREFTVPVFASNAAFEFLVLARRFDDLQQVVKRIRNRVGVFVFGTHYAGLIIPLIEAAGIAVDGYLTPINAAGIHMYPTQNHTVEALKSAGRPVIAIKPLGGGRVPPTQAFRYLFETLNIEATMVGIGSMEEAEETLTAAANTLASR